MKQYSYFSNMSILLGILLCGGGFWWIHHFYRQMHLLKEQVVQLKDQVGHQAPLSAAAIHPSSLGLDAICDWMTVRRALRDTVVQVFAYGAKFNWIEPYKAPDQSQGRGSAFFISARGELITNAHVVDQAKAVFIQIPSQGKRQFEVRVRGVSMERDLAVLELKPDDLVTLQQALSSIPFLTFTDSDSICGSEEIMTLGYPLGQQSLKGTTGIVSGRERMNGQFMIQISAPINPGNSGGPSINRCGEVIGVNCATISGAQNVNYLIPSNEVNLFLKQVEQFKQQDAEADKAVLIRKGSLGLIYGTSSDELARYLGNPVPGGLYVADVCPGSLVDKAGIKRGDMIYEINGHGIDIFGEIRVAWSEEKVGVVDFISRLMCSDMVTLKGYRSGAPFEFSFPFEYSYVPPIRVIYPGYEPVDYEVIGGMVVAELNMNLLQIMAPALPELMQYCDIRRQTEPVLVVTHLILDSVISRARVIAPGALLSEVNGKQVGTLPQFREAVRDSLTSGSLTLKTKDHLFAVFPFAPIIAEESKLSRNFCYTTTPFVNDMRNEVQKKSVAEHAS